MLLLHLLLSSAWLSRTYGPVHESGLAHHRWRIPLLRLRNGRRHLRCSPIRGIWRRGIRHPITLLLLHGHHLRILLRIPESGSAHRIPIWRHHLTWWSLISPHTCNCLSRPALNTLFYKKIEYILSLVCLKGKREISDSHLFMTEVSSRATRMNHVQNETGTLTQFHKKHTSLALILLSR